MLCLISSNDADKRFQQQVTFLHSYIAQIAIIKLVARGYG